VFVHEVDSGGYHHIFVFIPVVEEIEQLQNYKVRDICYLNKYYWNDNERQYGSKYADSLT
jgi:hypothetical protein